MGVLISEGSQLDSRFCSNILEKIPFRGNKNNLTIQSIFRSMNKIPKTHKMMNQSQLSMFQYRRSDTDLLILKCNIELLISTLLGANEHLLKIVSKDIIKLCSTLFSSPALRF